MPTIHLPGDNAENYDSFFDRIRPFFAPSVVRKIEMAYIFAKYGHRAQVRKEVDEDGDPVRYFEHLRRATLIGIDIAGIVRVDTICASIMHDLFEDTRLSPEMIEDNFGTDVCGIIKVTSKTPKDGYLDRFYKCADWRPYFVKACDRLDNLHSLVHTPVEFRKKQVEETVSKYYRLFDRMVVLTPIEHRDNTSRLRDMIQQEVAGISLT